MKVVRKYSRNFKKFCKVSRLTVPQGLSGAPRRQLESPKVWTAGIVLFFRTASKTKIQGKSLACKWKLAFLYHPEIACKTLNVSIFVLSNVASKHCFANWRLRKPLVLFLYNLKELSKVHTEPWFVTEIILIVSHWYDFFADNSRSYYGCARWKVLHFANQFVSIVAAFWRLRVDSTGRFSGFSIKGARLDFDARLSHLRFRMRLCTVNNEFFWMRQQRILIFWYFRRRWKMLLKLALRAANVVSDVSLTASQDFSCSASIIFYHLSYLGF